MYNKISTLKPGEPVQGDGVQGDLIDMTLEPDMRNSVKSAPYDEDGKALSKVKLYDKGILKNYWGGTRYCYYLDMEPTGNISNIAVKGGSKSLEEIKKEPYLEVLAFSDFRVDNMTGYFAGEIRLAIYFDGISAIPVTGGSVSGDIKEVHKNMFFSKEIQQDNNFQGPKTIQLFDVSIAGIQ